jgi:4-amino-4-deoxychorismate lyase
VVILAVLGRGVIPAGEPLLKADDLGLTRGDGIFTTMNVRGGNPWLLEDHLLRLQASAANMGLDLPAPEKLAELAGQACAHWDPQVEAGLKMVCTRGSESSGVPTVFATLFPVPATARGLRDSGVSLKTLSYGYPAEARQDTPWLLGGTKTLSYAINMASQRHALASGFDDALWVSSDGYALEGPTSSLVWHEGGELVTVPSAATGILPGISAAYALAHAGDLGLAAGSRMITPAELAEVSGAWLVSSVRGIVPIRAVDRVPLKESPKHTALRSLLGF